MPSARPRKALLFRNSRRTLSATALVAAVLVRLTGTGAAAQLPPADWTQFQGGSAHAGSMGGGPAPPFREAWKFPAPDGGISFPIVVRGVVMAVGQHGLFGLDLETGATVWTLIRNGGPLAAPAVGRAGEVQVLAFTDRSPSGEASLVGVDLADMRELWRTPLKAVSRSGVTVDGPNAFVGDDRGNVYAVDLASGKVRWTAKAVGAVQAPPAAANGVVYVASRAESNQQVQVLALRAADGGAAWDYRPGVGASTVSVPAVADGDVYAAFGDRILRAIGAEDGQERWGALVGALVSPVSSPAYADGSVFVADVSGGLYRVDAGTGSRGWSYQFNELVVRSSPVVSGPAVLLGLNDGRLVAVDRGSGNLVWQSPASQGLVGPIAVSADRVVAVKGGPHAGIVAFAHDPQGRLVDIPSPTKLDLGEALTRFGLAFAILFLALLGSSTVAARRMAPLELPESSPLDKEEGG